MEGTGPPATGEVWNTRYILPKGVNQLVFQEILITALLSSTTEGFGMIYCESPTNIIAFRGQHSQRCAEI